MQLPPPPFSVPVPRPAPSAPPPALSPEDKDRIEAWFDNDAKLTDIARAVDINVLELAEWSEQPHIAEALNAIERVAHRRTQSLRAEAEHAALARLLSITRDCGHPETARRAANAILGLTKSAKRPTDSPKPTPPEKPTASPLLPGAQCLVPLHPQPSPLIATPTRSTPTTSSAAPTKPASPSSHPTSDIPHPTFSTAGSTIPPYVHPLPRSPLPAPGPVHPAPQVGLRDCGGRGPPGAALPA